MPYSDKEKQREANRKWREANREYNRKWNEENKEKRVEYWRKYYEKNKEEMLEYQRGYYKKYYDKNKAQCIEYLGGKCVKCGTTHNLQFDHIKREGKKYTIASKLSYKFDNLKEELDKCQLLCAPCHLEKTAKEWASIG